MESAATLTSAKVDLLPHQVVLVHRLSNAQPRRFLIADEVGLGKTIETALLLRELASRGELRRALMVVPAGLVENWRRELNDIFNLDFEVFGSEGDVTDRMSNAFAKHNRLIVSVDTLKRRTRVLTNALRQLWQANAHEKVVIFATYLGSIDSLTNAIKAVFPNRGVEVLKGGDHGAKIAAQRRFKRVDGPRVLLCTAAGREGINLQFARVLFNYHLPWNPMDLEQRIGRIHRYGQTSTAQVYNLVATDTIEGQIFLLLEEKLHEIAQTLGKLDQHGQATEDLRAQVLGQLSSRLSYDRLYQEAILDPSLKRTRQEIELAMTNADLAREVVFELFQDLEKFNLGDYKRFDDEGRGMQHLVAFVQRAARLDAGEFRPRGEGLYELILPRIQPLLFTTDRDRALQEDDLHLLGLEHPFVKAWLDRYTELPPEARALVGKIDEYNSESGIITIWQVIAHGKGGQIHQRIVRLGMTPAGDRSLQLERLSKDLLKMGPAGHSSHIGQEQLGTLINGKASEALHRELVHTGALPEGGSYASTLLACVEIVPRG